MEGRALPLTGTSEGESANDAYRISKPSRISTGWSLTDGLLLPHLHRVYTGEQMWAEVEEAGIEDALAGVRLGNSFDLGGFLGFDHLKGGDPTRCISCSGSLTSFFSQSNP